MNFGMTCSLYGAAVLLLGISLAKSREKTIKSLEKARKMFCTVLPQFLSIVLLVGILLAFLPPNAIRQVLGSDSGILGMLTASLLGSISMVPVLAAFPIAAELLQNGVGTAQIAVFLGTLTTVGIVTLPIEFRYLGKKAALLRNGFFFIFSFGAAFILEVLLP